MHMRFTAEAVSTSVRYKIPGCEFQTDDSVREKVHQGTGFVRFSFWLRVLD